MDILSDISDHLSRQALAFYLGPDVTAITANQWTPVSIKGLADFFGKKVALPKRAKGNPWAAAQYRKPPPSKNPDGDYECRL